MYEEDEKTFTVYPHKKIKNDQKLVKNMEEPSSSWDVLEIMVLKTEIPNFPLAVASMKTRVYHTDTSSEVEKMKEKRIIKKRKISSSEDDLNSIFDAKSGKGKKKSKILKETVVRADKVDTREQSREKVMPSTLKDVTNSNMKTTKSNSFTTQKTFRPKTTDASQPVNQEFQNSFISMTSSTSDSDNNEEQAKFQNANENQRNELEEYQDNNQYMDSMEFEDVMSSTKLNHNESIGSRLQKIEENISTMMKNQSLILQHLERITFQGVNTHGAPPVHNSTAELRSICPISDEKFFNELEKKLSTYLKEPNKDKEFVKKRASMVDYYKKRIRAVGTAAPKNSIIKSLIEIYFDSEFIDKISWQETNGRFSIKNAIGHFDLFFDIVEAHLPGTYSSSEDASTAVKIYLHRRRENQAKHLKLTNQNRLNVEENQENE
ncbi:unnamed protein product [Chironomus riparius]|uniref:DUF4806 domain-containing protein n=1 Tax=Chironomus riparius TaxID=315576 RepID=A0A9N9WXQ5_9DIPT|nr:unnamed protein product [Chironomus riparius]